MKIETKKLITFLKQLRMGEINTCLFKFEDDGLHISTNSAAQSHASYAFIKKEAFIEYSAIGNVGIDELGCLVDKVLKKFNKELDFTVEGNMFTVTSKEKSVGFELLDEKFVADTKDMPDLEYATTFKIPISDMFSFVDDIKANKDVILTFETVEGGVMLSNTGKYKYKRNINSENTKGGVKCMFASPVISALEGILSKDGKGDLIFHVKTDYPIRIDYVTEDYNISFLIAPWVEKE